MKKTNLTKQTLSQHKEYTDLLSAKKHTLITLLHTREFMLKFALNDEELNTEIRELQKELR